LPTTISFVSALSAWALPTPFLPRQAALARTLAGSLGLFCLATLIYNYLRLARGAQFLFEIEDRP
jgi:hypothetical protein